MQGYKYDTHVHTSQGSACGTATGEEHARHYKELGYQGIIITDHFLKGNSLISQACPWEERVNCVCAGYEEAKKVGDEIGLQVFFGWEAGFSGTEFLVYGLDKEWLLSHEEMVNWTVEEQFIHIHEGGGMVIHAHPYREATYIPEILLYPNHVDGVEAINAANDKLDWSYNDKAMAYASLHRLPSTAGSDAHSTNAPRTSMIFREPVKDIHDFIRHVLLEDGYQLDHR